MRLRSCSMTQKLKFTQTQQLEQQVSNLTNDVKYFKRKLNPISEENNSLKERFHKLRFEIEDNLDQVLQCLDEDKQNHAKINNVNVNELFQLIKTQLHEAYEQSALKEKQVQSLQYALEIEQGRVSYMEQQFKNEYDKKILEINNQIEEKQYLINQGLEQIEELKKTIEKKENEIIKIELLIEKAITQTRNEEKQKIDELNFNIQELQNSILTIQSNHQIEIQKVQFQCEKDKKFLKDELEQCQGRIEQKYKKVYFEFQALQDKNAQIEKQIQQNRQQKEALEKQMIQINNKKQQTLDELIEERKQKGKDQKQIQEMVEQIKSIKQSLELEQKRHQNLKEKYEILDQENQNLYKNRNLEIHKLRQETDNLKSELIAQQQILLKQKQHFEEQLVFQRNKYEILLGNEINEKDEKYQMKDAEIQYDCPEFKNIIEDLERDVALLWKEKKSLNQKIANQQKQLDTQKEDISRPYEYQLKDLKQKQKLLITKQQQDYEAQREMIIMENNHKTQILLTQFNHQLNELKQQNSNLQTAIEKKEQEIIENQNQIELFACDILDKKIEIQKLKETNEINLFNFNKQVEDQQQIYKQHVEELNKQIDEGAKQIEEANRIRTSLQQTIKDLNNQIKIEQLNIKKQQEIIERKNREILFNQECIVKLNEKIRGLALDVENAKQTFNIFTRVSTQTMRIPQEPESMKHRPNFTDKKLSVQSRMKTSPDKRLRSISQSFQKLNSAMKLTKVD